MIILTRLNGHQLAVNSELIERVESTPDTHLLMSDGSRIVVRESLSEVVEKVRTFKASILALAERLDVVPPGNITVYENLPGGAASSLQSPVSSGDATLRVVPDTDQGV